MFRKICFLVLLVTVVTVAGLAPVFSCFKWGEVDLPEGITFKTLYEYAWMVKMSYQTEDAVKSEYGNKYKSKMLEMPKTKGRCLVLFDDRARTQYVICRGAKDLKNILENVNSSKSKDKKTGIYIHQSFLKGAIETYEALLPVLQKKYKTKLIGYSLGGAHAAILHLYLKQDGYQVQQTVTFGQPKFTNGSGVRKFRRLPLVRVVHEKDMVAMLPPSTMFGWYRHAGSEILLLDGIRYCYLEERKALNPSVGDFWSSIENGQAELDDHYINEYLDNLKKKIKQSTPISDDERDRYLGLDW